MKSYVLFVFVIHILIFCVSSGHYLQVQQLVAGLFPGKNMLKMQKLDCEFWVCESWWPAPWLTSRAPHVIMTTLTRSSKITPAVLFVARQSTQICRGTFSCHELLAEGQSLQPHGGFTLICVLGIRLSAPPPLLPACRGWGLPEQFLLHQAPSVVWIMGSTFSHSHFIHTTSKYIVYFLYIHHSKPSPFLLAGILSFMFINNHFKWGRWKTRTQSWSTWFYVNLCLGAPIWAGMKHLWRHSRYKKELCFRLFCMWSFTSELNLIKIPL